MNTSKTIPAPRRLFLLTGMVFLIFSQAACHRGPAEKQQPPSAELRQIRDMRGKEVGVPTEIRRVVTVSDGLVESVMAHLGQMALIVGLGSRCLQTDFSYSFPGADEKPYTFGNGMNPVSFLHPQLMSLPMIATSGTALNYEALAALDPDVVIIRAGSCTLPGWNDETTLKTIGTLEALGIPVFVLKGPPCFNEPTVGAMAEEIRLIGQLFGQEEKAAQLAAYLDDAVRLIVARTAGIPEQEKPRVLMLGLSPKARAAGGAGNTKGDDTIESYFLEEIVHARNAFAGKGGRSTYLLLSTEQIFALDPDVIILPTAAGYHPPEELYSAPYYRNLRELRAVKQRRVYALPWTPCNCAKRLEYPIEILIMAKAAYPDRFRDILVHEWVLDFYRKTYGVDGENAKKIRSVQWLDWTVDENF